MIFLIPTVAWTDEPKNEKNQHESVEKSFITDHTVNIDGKEVPYIAKAGTMVLRKEDQSPTAKIFYTAYTKRNMSSVKDRPITFVFNGGPGSASVWLHLGLLGPKRVDSQVDGEMLRPPGRLVENEFSLLDKTDLVFIDPVSTGYSRAAEGGKPNQFHGFRGDIESVGKFIRLYVTRNQRWLSPKFVLGESYGTTRAAALSTELQEKHGMYLNGVLLVSSVLQFQTIRFHNGNDLPYQLFFPSYTATAYYHKALDKSLLEMPIEKVLKQSEHFTVHELAPALLLGDSLKKEKFDLLVSRASKLSGLSQKFIRDARLRIHASEFMKELLRKKDKTVGRLDSRFTGKDKRRYGTRYEYDPSNYQIHGPFSAAINHYLRAELKFQSDLPYEVLSSRVHPWNYDEFTNKYVDVAENLRRSMNINPYLKVYIASGYYDLATPYFATDYTFRSMGLGDQVRKNVKTFYYPAGHMMYIHRPSLKKQKSDISEFMDWALKAEKQ